MQLESDNNRIPNATPHHSGEIGHNRLARDCETSSHHSPRRDLLDLLVWSVVFGPRKTILATGRRFVNDLLLDSSIKANHWVGMSRQAAQANFFGQTSMLRHVGQAGKGRYIWAVDLIPVEWLI